MLTNRKNKVIVYASGEVKEYFNELDYEFRELNFESDPNQERLRLILDQIMQDMKSDMRHDKALTDEIQALLRLMNWRFASIIACQGLVIAANLLVTTNEIHDYQLCLSTLLPILIGVFDIS